MKKFSLLQQVLFGAAALTAGYCIYYSFFKSLAVPVAGKMAMLPADNIIYNSNNDTTQTEGLTPQDKEDLFYAALGYRGGANPPDFMLQEYRKNAAAALLKITEYGLQAEYEVFLNEQNNQLPRA